MDCPDGPNPNSEQFPERVKKTASMDNTSGFEVEVAPPSVHAPHDWLSESGLPEAGVDIWREVSVNNSVRGVK